jgi:hypothetical protein
MLKIGVLLILLLPALLALEVAIVKSRPLVPGQQVVTAADGSLQFEPAMMYWRDSTLPAIYHILVPIFLLAFVAGVALLVTALIRSLLMRRRTI